jgi:O-methyltransferase involved in polyketide biosynthesis
MSTADRFSTISPSAKSLLLVKARTSVPYANEAARLLWGDEAVDAKSQTVGDSRARHFELRARSLDDALRDVGATRILELAAGLSFRGLAMAEREGVHYVDTDLREMVETKSSLISKLHPTPLAGHLALRVLNALDAGGLKRAVDELPPGPVAIVHEGLLMYLDDGEKAQLAASLRDALLDRGGWWITADVYMRSEGHLFREKRTKEFLEKHRVEEKKFADRTAAQGFFESNGFSIEKKMVPLDDPWPVRETWVLVTRDSGVAGRSVGGVGACRAVGRRCRTAEKWRRRFRKADPIAMLADAALAGRRVSSIARRDPAPRLRDTCPRAHRLRRRKARHLATSFDESSGRRQHLHEGTVTVCRRGIAARAARPGVPRRCCDSP